MYQWCNWMPFFAVCISRSPLPQPHTLGPVPFELPIPWDKSKHMTYHWGAPIGNHCCSGCSSCSTHLWRHAVETYIGSSRAGQLSIHACMRHHAKGGRVWARHCQGCPQASCCKETCHVWYDWPSGRTWPVNPVLVIVVRGWRSSAPIYTPGPFLPRAEFFSKDTKHNPHISSLAKQLHQEARRINQHLCTQFRKGKPRNRYSMFTWLNLRRRFSG